jgi:hypothetical protein
MLIVNGSHDHDMICITCLFSVVMCVVEKDLKGLRCQCVVNLPDVSFNCMETHTSYFSFVLGCDIFFLSTGFHLCG